MIFWDAVPFCSCRVTLRPFQSLSPLNPKTFKAGKLPLSSSRCQFVTPVCNARRMINPPACRMIQPPAAAPLDDPTVKVATLKVVNPTSLGDLLDTLWLPCTNDDGATAPNNQGRCNGGCPSPRVEDYVITLHKGNNLSQR